MYVGMTGRDPEVRWGEHAMGTDEAKAALNFETVASGLTEQEARILEQQLINKYGLDNLLNKINSIAPKFWDPLGIEP